MGDHCLPHGIVGRQTLHGQIKPLESEQHFTIPANSLYGPSIKHENLAFAPG